VDAGPLLAHDDRADVDLGRRFDDVVDRVADQELDAFSLEDLGDGVGHLHDDSLPSIESGRRIWLPSDASGTPVGGPA
jgi:hypothetical protein